MFRSWSFVYLTRVLLDVNVNTTAGLKLSTFSTKIVTKKHKFENLNLFIRYINCSRVATAKSFFETENGHAHSVLEKSSNYSVTSSSHITSPVGQTQLSDQEYANLLSDHWDSYNTSEVVTNFKLVSYCKQNNMHEEEDISQSRYDKMCRALITKSVEFEFDEMREVLHCLALWPPTESSQSHNFKEVWKSLDESCVAKMKQWSVEQILLLNDHWYQLNLAGINYFTWNSLNRFSRKAARKSPYTLVQSLFYINLRRTFPPGVDFIDYQAQLESCAHQLTIEELGVCAMAFFKTQKKVRSIEVLRVMISKTAEQADTVDSITLAAILKVLRSSLPIELVDQLFDLLGKLLPRVPQLPLVCCLHVALAGSNIQILHPPLFEATLNRFFAELSSCRLKDLERMSFLLSLYNWPARLQDGRDVYQLLAEEVKNPDREIEIHTHPRCLANILNYLAMTGVYLHPQISKVLSSTFVQNIYSKSIQQAGQEILSLDVAVQIDCPDYSGSTLPQKSRCLFSKRVSQHPHKWKDVNNISGRHASDRLLMEIISVTSSLVKDPEMIFVGHLLPQYLRPDILVRVSDTLDFLPIPSSLQTMDLGEVKRPNGAGHWIALVVAGHNLLLRGTHVPLGSLVQKLRLLNKIGYTPKMIPWTEWQQSPNKVEYIMTQIKSTLSNQENEATTKN